MTKKTHKLHCKPPYNQRAAVIDADEIIEKGGFYCPPFEPCLWSSHPRISLQFDDNYQALCPYCGTSYVLMPDK